MPRRWLLRAPFGRPTEGTADRDLSGGVEALDSVMEAVASKMIGLVQRLLAEAPPAGQVANA